jgi:acyl carrier protein
MALSEKDIADLKEGLRRCSAETVDAALRFREHGDVAAIPTVVFGLIERYQPSTATMRLKDANENTRLIEDLGLDSLTLLELVLAIEEVLNLQINNDELKEIRTLGRLNQFLKDKISGVSTPAPAQQHYSRERIALVLPQQHPFLFLDEAELTEDAVRARYTIKGDEFFLAGHFKDEPIFPASILFEALGQAACLWVLEKVPKLLGKEITSNHVFFATLDGAHVYRKARPGQQLTIEGRLVKLRDPVALFHGTIVSAGERIASIDRLVLAFGDQGLTDPVATAAATVPALSI